MTTQDLKDAVIRYLALHTKNANSTILFETLLQKIIILFPECKGIEDFEIKMKDILIQGEKDGLIVSLDSVRMREENVIKSKNYFITDIGKKNSASIVNEIVLNRILDANDKDIACLNFIIFRINPYSVYAEGGLEIDNLLRDTFLKNEINQSEIGRICGITSGTNIYWFLKENGFIKTTENHFYKFNKRGRKLIEIGNYQSFVNWETDQNKKEYERQLLSDKLLTSSLFNAEITKRLYWTNLWIAVATLVAAFYYSKELLVYWSDLYKNSHLYYSIGVTVFLLFLGMGLGVSLLLIGQQINRKLKNKKAKSFD